MKRRIALSLDKELLDQVDEIAAIAKRSRTSLIEDALEEYLGGGTRKAAVEKMAELLKGPQ